jgi:hypothetical protein
MGDNRLRGLPVDPRHQSLSGSPVAAAHRLEVHLQDLAAVLLNGNGHPIEGGALALATPGCQERPVTPEVASLESDRSTSRER